MDEPRHAPTSLELADLPPKFTDLRKVRARDRPRRRHP
jgi:hypothetical protein